MWVDLAKAFCLMLVLEGVMPFLAPGRWRNMAALLAQVDDRSMRMMGLFSMLLGAGTLYFING
ncbi:MULTISPECIES: DUF2065 domain-containing protein [Porticoccus]|jgi:uncharacterized protein YjeT (DUF2065 family)|uniref:DUF2065 domain-containing protein n=1 Tax=Porticoccus TaxID=1123967 RepID=UPI00055FD99C|nr:DUF2065 domain-containing protein [Porticoccus hydrocarbonoclasticus]MBG57403.1 DUF2065 domain-containing protein [Porticoccus sp.]PHS74246.1 MAG: DUF2065 domain-containing protein [Porticoccus sp.]|tara:strand:- start:12624 stop:12812 length:189 start_codon:yes stop_codon:yes gene_type:complete